MITLRRAGDRGFTRFPWLQSWHTFSFGDYHDPRHMGFSDLRVINDDIVAPAQGFGMHPHRDMEILTVVLEGALQHRDSMGNGSVIRPGEVQRMTAGTGVRHSEINPSPDEPVHLLQIWILPNRLSLPPGYEQKAFPLEGRRNALTPVATSEGRAGTLTIHQDATMLLGHIDAKRTLEHPLAPGRTAWVHVTRGTVDLNGKRLEPGDGAAVGGETALRLAAADESEVVVFDLAA